LDEGFSEFGGSWRGASNTPIAGIKHAPLTFKRLNHFEFHNFLEYLYPTED